ncbi:hypothetical protein ACHAW6_011724 [Cyclotella cf. meneghiniana]
MSSKSSNGGQKKRQDGKIADKFRGACPPHKVKDLDALVKQCKGDETKIQSQIMQWWEEPQVAEPEWEAVGKANKKTAGAGATEKKPASGAGAAVGVKHDPRPVIAPPRRREGRGMGRGTDKAGRGGRPRVPPTGLVSNAPAASSAPAPSLASKSPGVPSPVTYVPGPKGAWGQPIHTAPPQIILAEPLAVSPDEKESVAPAEEIISQQDPTPSGLPAKSNAPSSGNVWATRGSAHLIRAEKVKSPPIPPVAPQQPVPQPPSPSPPPEEEPEYEPEEPLAPVVDVEQIPPPEPEPLLPDSFMGVESVLPPSVNGANINASGWEPLEPAESMSQPDAAQAEEEPQMNVLPVEPTVSVAPQTIPAPVPSVPASVQPTISPQTLPAAVQPSPPAPPAKPSVLNMGHWETGDADEDDDELDFGFGGFGNESEDAAPASAVTASNEATLQNHASPARPPPGLSMPPMPAGAMLVHELENKLENTSLGATTTAAVEEVKSLAENKDIVNANVQSSSSHPQSFNNDLGTQNIYPGMTQYGGYGMGMYSMGTSNGFGSMPPAQFPLGGPIGQQQQQQPKPQTGLGQPPQQGVSRSGSSPHTLGQPQVPPYGMQNPANEGGATATDALPNATGGMPPGVGQIPAGMQGYPNPAFMYGQYNQMGHPAYAGMQYGYGQGQQFGVQGGFGYHQVMGQGGYGAPYGHDGRHDDQGNHSHMRDNHHSTYPKGGGYRHNRQNNHSQGGHQYGNNYQGQSYGGGGPYGNSYQGQYGGHDGQFPRGYGGSNDHYGMQQQGGGYPGGGYQDNNDQNKGKPKGPHRVQQGFHQQPVGLQGSTQNDSGGGGWPPAGQTSWGGNWQQEN